MSALHHALQQLDDSIANLEDSAANAEGRYRKAQKAQNTGGQNDLFSFAAPQSTSIEANASMSPAEIAAKLDEAVAKMEALLEDETEKV